MVIVVFGFDDLCEYTSDYMKKNECSFSHVSDGTMTPVIVVKYHGFESDDKFDSDKFGKVYMTRDGTAKR